MSYEPAKRTETPAMPSPARSEEFKLHVDGFKGTPEEIELQWLENVYRGRGDRMPQLTLRALLMGSVLGGVLSLTNLYIGLKSGWGLVWRSPRASFPMPSGPRCASCALPARR